MSARRTPPSIKLEKGLAFLAISAGFCMAGPTGCSLSNSGSRVVWATNTAACDTIPSSSLQFQNKF
ncbi:hypothetical protein M758_UG288000 [Ceratodon purpureus]|nr:hypothetical protein M758_UG288000 [Ceratodon purpureus]